MKHILTSAVIALFVTTGAFAHGGNSETNEQMDSTMSMIPMPIRIGLDGSIAWGYMLKPMGHMGGHMGGMNGGMSGGMNGGHMNDGMTDMPSWMFKVMPMLTLSGDYYSRIINLATPKNINENTIQIDDNSKGYLAVVNKNYVVGASGGLMAIPSVLKAMKKAMAEQNLEIFSKNFGKLGQLALTNRFVLEEIFTTAGKTVPKAVLKVKGSRVLNTKVQL